MASHTTESSLAARRKAAGLTRQALGSQAGGISTSTIRRIELGQVRPNQSTLHALALVLKCNPADLTDKESDA